MGELIDCDVEHLRLLKIGYYVLAGSAVVPVLFGSLYLGIAWLSAADFFTARRHSNGAPPEIVGWILLAIGLFVLLFGVVMAGLNVWSGQSLRDRRNRVFCLVSACISLLNFPLGTVIGISTLIVLNRPSVRALFEPQTTIN